MTRCQQHTGSVPWHAWVPNIQRTPLCTPVIHWPSCRCLWCKWSRLWRWVVNTLQQHMQSVTTIRHLERNTLAMLESM